MSFPQWFAGQALTADGLNGRNMRLVMQENDQTVNNSTAYVASEITFTPEPNATYWYTLLVSYSADGAGDFKWNWNALGATFASFTQARSVDATGTFNAPATVIFRRPGNTTDRIAGGATTGTPTDSFYSAYDQGTFVTDGTITPVTMQFAQATAAAVNCILRGGNQTRLLYQRIA